MKKSILIIICLVTGLFFTGINEVAAQWSVKVHYDTTNCNCGTITSRTIDWVLRDLVTQEIIASDIENLTGQFPFIVSGEETIIYDAQDRYRFSAKITFYEIGKCCEGSNSKTFDGDELVEDEASILIIMN